MAAIKGVVKLVREGQRGDVHMPEGLRVRTEGVRWRSVAVMLLHPMEEACGW